MTRAFGGPDLDWLQALLIEATQLTLDSWPPRCRPCAVLNADLIEAMLEAEGQPRDLLVRAAFLPPDSARSRFGLPFEPVWESLPGLGASAGRHPAAVLAALGQSGCHQQLRALILMQKCRPPPAAFLGKLFELACGRSRRVHAQAALLLAGALPLARPFLQEKAARGGSGERACAARILWRAEGESARAFLAAQAPRQRSRKVARVLDELLAPPPQSCADEIPVPGLPAWWKLALGPAAGPPARLGTAPALAPLLASLKKEKNPAARSAMMTSLAQLGVPPDQFLDRAGLLKESARGLAAGIPAALAWFPFQRLPPVHWADNARLVEPEIVRWWLAQCCRRKSPEPGPLLRTYAACLETSGRRALGQFVLEAWIRRDTQPAAHPRPKASAIAVKGVLALAGACAAAEAAPLVHRYLERWYGQRAAQCRALLQMLAWVEHPSAVRLLVAVGGGFRTRSIQEEAGRQAEYLAERKGCKLSELNA
jgi:hypothetical protein